MAQHSREDGQDRNDRIAARAFDRYISRGMEPGRDMDDWLEAEREIDADQSMPLNGQDHQHIAAASEEAARMDRTEPGLAGRADEERSGQNPVSRRGRESRRNRTTL